MATNLTKVVQKIDWAALRKQKLCLLDEANLNKECREYLDGLIHLIDAIQDAAVDDGIATAKEVFGENFGEVNHGEN